MDSRFHVGLSNGGFPFGVLPVTAVDYGQAKHERTGATKGVKLWG